MEDTSSLNRIEDSSLYVVSTLTENDARKFRSDNLKTPGLKNKVEFIYILGCTVQVNAYLIQLFDMYPSIKVIIIEFEKELPRGSRFFEHLCDLPGKQLFIRAHDEIVHSILSVLAQEDLIYTNKLSIMVYLGESIDKVINSLPHRLLENLNELHLYHGLIHNLEIFHQFDNQDFKCTLIVHLNEQNKDDFKHL